MLDLIREHIIILKTILSENQGPNENPSNIDEETLEKFIES